MASTPGNQCSRLPTHEVELESTGPTCPLCAIKFERTGSTCPLCAVKFMTPEGGNGELESLRHQLSVVNEVANQLASRLFAVESRLAQIESHEAVRPPISVPPPQPERPLPPVVQEYLRPPVTPPPLPTQPPPPLPPQPARP